MTARIERKRGRKPGEGGLRVPRADYAGIALLYAFEWPPHDIGKLWGVSGTRVGRIVREWEGA